MPSYHFYAFLLLIFLPHTVAADGDSPTEFAFTVFTDLAPLLALFGEQFARQFMSESLTWLDHIIFAMAPLGIITAIVGAIRVAGPPWARAFIGRARESRAAVEIELMSSTSREVCEVYNGKGVVRAMGTPKLTQFILFPPEYRDHDRTCGIHTLKTAYDREPPYLEKGKYDETVNLRRRLIWGRSKSKPPDEEAPQTLGLPVYSRLPSEQKQTNEQSIDTKNTESAKRPPFPTELEGSPPNLQLNLPFNLTSHKSTIKELWIAAAIAIFLQLSVVVVSAVTSFHPRLQRTIGRPQMNFGFWLFIAGTVCQNSGMILCSFVIEQSTREWAWRKTKTSVQGQESSLRRLLHKAKRSNSSKETPSLQLFWMQQKHTVNDQDFEPFLIFGGYKNEILTSSLLDHERWKEFWGMHLPQWIRGFAANHYEFLTICASVLGLVGFILQFEGLRGLAWPTAVSQLGAILLVALLRAFIRRRLGKNPKAVKAIAGHELDCKVNVRSHTQRNLLSRRVNSPACLRGRCATGI
ncbi:hypothetical protein BDW02DRAFT_510211 [Decorospora gaudefroyi]|uniref:Uncharacterized protein n=1 Tax=Decorospora gaudefroyi TaxID=184978 RepID=A0A6A5JYC9_9PLEO|nr:hypothetical protein BDW02DRAFT_510211 [Decorospora gaudefroyi]